MSYSLKSDRFNLSIALTIMLLFVLVGLEPARNATAQSPPVTPTPVAQQQDSAQDKAAGGDFGDRLGVRSEENSDDATNSSQERAVDVMLFTESGFIILIWNPPPGNPIEYEIRHLLRDAWNRTFKERARGYSSRFYNLEYVQKFRVRARYADGYGPWSGEPRIVTEPIAHYRTIRDISVTSEAPGKWTANWTAPLNLPDYYQVYSKPADRVEETYARSGNINTTSYEWPHAEKGKEYLVWVEAIYPWLGLSLDFINGSSTERVLVRVAATPIATPTPAPTRTPSPVATPAPTRTPTPVAPPRSELAGTVTNVRAAYNNSGDDPITLFVWDEPAAKPRDYEIFVTVPGDSPHGFTRLETHVAIYAAVTDFRIRARYADGHHGPWVEWHDVAVRLLSDLLAIRNFGVVSDSPGVIAAAWDPNLYPPDRYEVYYRLADSAPATRMLAGSTTSTSYEISDSITEDEQYLVWVEAVYDNVFVRETTRSGESLILVERTNAETENRVGSVENLSARVSVMLSDDNPNSAVGLQRFNEIRSQEQSAALGGHSRASGLSEGVRVGSDRSVINYNNSVVLSWDPPRSGPSPDGYRIYRSKYTAGDVTQVDILSADTGGIRTTFTDTTPESITMYGYQVSALLGDEEGEESNEIRLITNPVPNTPTSPVNVSATQNAQGHVVVTWEAPEHIPVGPCTYDVYRDREVNSTELTDLTFTDEQVKPDTYHFYGVWATCGGYKGSSAYVSIRTNTRGDGVPRKPSLPYPNVYVGEPGVKFMFLFDDSAVTQFVISREVGTSKLPIVEPIFPTITFSHVPGGEEPQNEVPFTDTQVIEGSSYNYYIKSKNAQDVLSDPAIHSAKANRVSNRPLGVGNLRATDTRAGRIQLQWNAPDQTGDNPAITGYKIYRQWGVAEEEVVEGSGVTEGKYKALNLNYSKESTEYVDNTEEWTGTPLYAGGRG